VSYLTATRSARLYVLHQFDIYAELSDHRCRRLGRDHDLSNFGFDAASGYAPTDMVLGDQGTYFTANSNKLLAVNVSGAEEWRWQPTQALSQSSPPRRAVASREEYSGHQTWKMWCVSTRPAQ